MDKIVDYWISELPDRLLSIPTSLLAYAHTIGIVIFIVIALNYIRRRLLPNNHSIIQPKMSSSSSADIPIPNIVKCSKPDCIRCYRGGEIQQRALRIFQSKYVGKPGLLRIQAALKYPTDPYIFFVDGLRRKPIWKRDEFKPIRTLGEYMDWFQGDLRYMSLSANDPKNNWRTLSFMNQGEWIEENSGQTSDVLRGVVTGLMEGCVFGNAFFSILKPGSQIEPHVGPTNIRIRCHYGIQTPKTTPGVLECSITVDGEPYEWREYEWVIFDDSFLHGVKYHVDSTRMNIGDAPDRCVLIMDLWHPDLTRDEIECIKGIFPA